MMPLRRLVGPLSPRLVTALLVAGALLVGATAGPRAACAQSCVEQQIQLPSGKLLICYTCCSRAGGCSTYCV